MVGLPLSGNKMGKQLGEILGAISKNEVDHGRPMLSAIVINTEGKLGGGFFPFAKQLGLLKSDDPAGQQAFWEAQKREIYHIWQQKFSK